MKPFLRALGTTAAGAWLGGMILIAIVAQTTFSEIRKTDVAQPNAIAGRVMAKNFSRFDSVQWICVGVLVATQVGRMGMGDRTRGEWVRLFMIAAAGGLFAFSALVMTPRILGLQETVAGENAEVAVKAAFDSFHETSVRIAKVNLVLVLAIVMSLAMGGRREATA